MKNSIETFNGPIPPFKQSKFVRHGDIIVTGLLGEANHKDLVGHLGITPDKADDYGFIFYSGRNNQIIINGSSGSFGVASSEARTETGSCVCGLVGEHVHVIAQHPLKGTVFDSKNR